jgi:2-hydroxy fatty acid dioxygenase
MASTKEVIKVSDNKFDFGQFYFSYAKYHYNDANKWLHIIFIPTIVFTLLGMLHYATVFGHLTLLGTTWQVDYGFLLLSVLLPIYMFVDFVTGLVSTAFFLLQLHLSNYLYANRTALFSSESQHFNVLLYLHIAAWIAQFIGHGIFEKRAPALLDNMLLMFVAPFFFMFEVLNMGFGYKQKEVREWNKYVALEIKQYRESKIKKRTE